MPLFYQQVMDSDTKLAVWKIEEDEAFFLEKVPLQRSITHPHKRLQHLAGRYLLPYLFPHFPVPLILIADTLKPYLEDEAYHFSISHGGDFAAAIVSKTKRVGVDVELVSAKVQKVQHKFVSAEEAEVVRVFEKSPETLPHPEADLQNKITNDVLTVIWSCKEAVFKWYGRGEVDFKEHIVVREIKQMPDGKLQTGICFRKNEGQHLTLHSLFFPVGDPNYKLALSYVIT